MARSNKKSTTKDEAAPAVIKDTKPLKKGKRKAKDDSETKVNLKKPKKDVIAPFEKKKSDQKEIMKGFADCLRRIEAKVDLLATKTDPTMKPPAKAASDSEDSSTDTSSDDQVTATFADCLRRIEAKVDLLATKTDLHAILISAKGEKVPTMKPPAKAASDSEDSSTDTSSDDEVTATKNPDAAAKIKSSSSEDESSSDDEPAKRTAASAKPNSITKPAAKDSSSSSDDEPAKKTAATAKPNSIIKPAAKDSSSSSDDEPAKKTAESAKPNAITKPAAKDSSSSNGGNGQSISVEGFDSSVPVDDIKSALSKHFSSFGEITRVFVPTDRETGASLGYAYIDLKGGAEKALELGGHDVGGWKLVVGKAEPILSRSRWPFPGRCGSRGHCGRC